MSLIALYDHIERPIMKSALLVVDAQRIYTDKRSDMSCDDSTRTIARINKLIKAFQDAERPIFLIRHIHKRDGSDIGRMFDFSGEPEDDFNFKEGSMEVEYDDRLIRAPEFQEFVKTRYSAFVGTDLEGMLREQKIECVVICGFMTNFCCEATARHAHDIDFHVDFITDATGTPGTENFDQSAIRKCVADSMGAGIGRVMSTNSFLKQWVCD